jgi:hypothetical protein
LVKLQLRRSAWAVATARIQLRISHCGDAISEDMVITKSEFMAIGVLPREPEIK